MKGSNGRKEGTRKRRRGRKEGQKERRRKKKIRGGLNAGDKGRKAQSRCAHTCFKMFAPQAVLKDLEVMNV